MHLEATCCEGPDELVVPFTAASGDWSKGGSRPGSGTLALHTKSTLAMSCSRAELCECRGESRPLRHVPLHAGADRGRPAPAACEEGHAWRRAGWAEQGHPRVAQPSTRHSKQGRAASGGGLRRHRLMAILEAAREAPGGSGMGFISLGFFTAARSGVMSSASRRSSRGRSGSVMQPGLAHCGLLCSSMCNSGLGWSCPCVAPRSLVSNASAVAMRELLANSHWDWFWGSLALSVSVSVSLCVSLSLSSSRSLSSALCLYSTGDDEAHPHDADEDYAIGPPAGRTLSGRTERPLTGVLDICDSNGMAAGLNCN